MAWLILDLHRATRAVNRILSDDGPFVAALGAVPRELQAAVQSRMSIALAHGEARLLVRYLALLEYEALRLSAAEESLGRALVAARELMSALGDAPTSQVPHRPDHALDTSILSAPQLADLGTRSVVEPTLGPDTSTAISRYKTLADPYHTDDWSQAFEHCVPLDAEVDRRLATLTLRHIFTDNRVGTKAFDCFVTAIRVALALESIAPSAGTRLQLPLDLRASPAPLQGQSRLIAHVDILEALKDHASRHQDRALADACAHAKPFDDPFSAYLLHVSWSISAAAIAWLRDPGPSNVVDIAERRTVRKPGHS